MREIGMAMPMGRAALKLVMREMVAPQPRRATGCSIMQVTRGAVRRDHPDPGMRPAAHPDHDRARPGSWRRVQRATRPKASRSSPSPTSAGRAATSRRCSFCPIFWPRQAARKAGAFEAWLVDDDGFVTEGASTNAWIVDEDGQGGHPRSQPTPSCRASPGGSFWKPRRRPSCRWWSANSPSRRRKARGKPSCPRPPARRCRWWRSTVKTIGDGKPGPVTRRIHELYAAQSGHRKQADSARFFLFRNCSNATMLACAVHPPRGARNKWENP